MAKMLGLMMVLENSAGENSMIIISPDDDLLFVPSEAFDEATTALADGLKRPGVVGAFGAIFKMEV